MNLRLPDNPKESELLLWVIDLDEPACPRCGLPMSWCECHDMREPAVSDWKRSTDKARARAKAHVAAINAEGWLSTVQAAELIGHTPDWLRKVATKYPGTGMFTTAQGYVFRRAEAHSRAPLEWDSRTLRKDE